MAMIVDAFAGKLVERLTNVIEEKAIMVLGVKDELQRLRRRMERIARVLKDAEKRRIQDETVKGWVDELKDFMYDADDIIDLCLIQGAGLLQQQQQDGDHHYSPAAESSTTASTKRVSCCNFPDLLSCVRTVPFRYEIADKIKSLNDRLTEISEDKDRFNFLSTSSKSNDDAYVMSYEASYRQSSHLPELDIVGWDIRDATNNLVELLVSQHEQKYCLFAIVGMGGIGKTTLAQQIYNDSKINDAFLLRSWICVSKSSTPRTDLLREIIRNVGGICGETVAFAEVQNMLCDVLRGKSLFLVLDDVWDDMIWNDLIKNLVRGTTIKCRVLVTTRDRSIGIKMGATHIHTVNKLPLDSGWELLCKRVFTNNDIRDMQKMKDIGMQIVEKCDGLPIAIKTVAGVLVTKDQNRREWQNVLNDDAWTVTGLPEELRGALYLSYESLPSSLKQCFLYCSFNPPGHEFFRENIIYEWIAEGFIETSGSASMDDVANGYYRDLIWRSFLQPSPRFVDMTSCTMHDTLRALAQFLAGDENFSGDPQEAQSNRSLKKLRRVNVISKRESVSISHLDGLRRLSLRTPPSLNTQQIQNLKHLRLLILNGDKIQNIPDSIGDLVHLRFLNLSRTSICKLPDSLGNLVNLQFLVLDECKSLRILPRSITKLRNLLQLRLFGCPLNYIPKGIGKLEHLHYVMGFIVGNRGDGGEEGCDFEEIQMLEQLTQFRIENLENVTNKSSLVLSNKTHLRLLVLNCTPNIQGNIQQQKMNDIVQVFDALCPPSGLEKLRIYNYFGYQYPKWMISSTIDILPELTSLHLHGCSNCPQLPQLGQLPRLQYLNIRGAAAVVSIGPEFLGDNGEPTVIAFPKLEYLIFENMINWEEWSMISGDQEDNEPESSNPLVFPCLKRVVIFNCPKLKALPKGLNQASIQELKITRALSLTRLSHLPALRELQVIECPMLECVEKLDSLKRLTLVDIEKNSPSIPCWLINFLQQCEEKPHDDRLMLHLECSVKALHDCLQGHRYWSFLQRVPRFIGYANKQRMFLKHTREPYYYETNITDED